MTNVRAIPIIDRTAERLARIRDSVPVMAAPANSAPIPETIAPVERPATRVGGLGPKQLQWLRENVEHFAVCERLAVKAEEHRQALKEAVKQ